MIKYIKENKFRFISSVILTLLVSFGSIYAIYMRSVILNTLLEVTSNIQKRDDLLKLVIIILLTIVATEIFKMLLGLNNASLLRRWKLKLGSTISKNIATTSYNNFHLKDTGYYISMYTGDLPLVNEYIFKNSLDIFNSITLSLLSILLLYFTSIKLVVFSVILLVILHFVGSLFGKKIGSMWQLYSVQNGEFNNTLKEYISGYDELKNFGRLDFLKEKIDSSQETIENSIYNIQKYTAFAGFVSSGTKNLFEASMFVFTTYLVFTKELTIGLLATTPFVLGIFLDSTISIIEKYMQNSYAKALKSKMENAEISEVSSYPKLENKIDFSSVSLSYGDKEILKDLNITFEKGKKYAIVGESGSGKSTILKLILGRLSTTSGNILVDNTKLEKTNSIDIDFSKEISYVSQENYMFDLSIRDNITLGESFTDQEINSVIQEVKLDKLIPSLEDGLNTKIGNLGSKLSGGERQRLSLARALIRNNPVIILDEATSAVDKDTSKEIENIILSKKDKTIIMISHHLNDDIKDKLDKVYEINKL